MKTKLPALARRWSFRLTAVCIMLVTIFVGNIQVAAGQALSEKQKQWYRYGISYADSESGCTTAKNGQTAAGFDEAQFAQHLFVGVSSGGVAKEILAKYDIGGIFLMSSGSPGRVSEELKASIPGMQSAAKTPLLIATDQEYTSTVNSFSLADGKKATDLAGMSYEDVKAEGARFGTALAAAGVNMDFAPDVDLLSEGNAVIANNYRAISSSPDTVTQKAKAFSEGLAGTKVTPVIKHFPGHGRSSGDSHQTLPTTPPLSELEQSDLLPFKNLAGQDNMAMMIGHLNVPGLTDGKPASMSSAAYTYLRNKLAYRGLVITDELAGMAGAGGGSLGSKISDSLNAGADMALFNVSSMADFESAYNDAKGSTKDSDDTNIRAKKRFYGLNVSEQGVSVAEGTTASGTSCCVASNGVTSVTLAGDNNTEKILNFIMSNQKYKFSLVQAAGIVGNFFIEAGGSNPDGSIPESSMTVGPNPAAVSGAGFYGIAQWGLGRWQGPNSLNQFAADHGGKWDDLDIQLRFMAWELGVGEDWPGHDPTETASLEAIKPYQNSTSTEDAGKVAYEFEAAYERCGCTQDKRATAGRDVHTYYADKGALSQSGSTAASGSSSGPASSSSGGNCTNTSGSATAAGDFVFYNQWEPGSAWAGLPYGGGTYADSACGATATAMVVATWKDKSITPVETGAFTLSIGAQFQGGRLPEVFEHFGMKSEYIGTGNLLDEAIAALKDGKMVIASASGTNPYTSVGHFVVFRGITPDGQILLGDPNAGKPGSGMKREENNTRPWSPDEIRAAAPGGFNSMNIITKP